MNEEHQMYLSHLQLPQGPDPPQLMPNMVHSLTQQIMREDSLLYLYQLLLRLDHAWRLGLYLFYSIYASTLSQPNRYEVEIYVPKTLSTCELRDNEY